MSLTNHGDKVVNEVKQCWQANPEWNFGYLIAYIVKSGKLQLEITDEDFILKCKEAREFNE